MKKILSLGMVLLIATLFTGNVFAKSQGHYGLPDANANGINVVLTNYTNEEYDVSAEYVNYSHNRESFHLYNSSDYRSRWTFVIEHPDTAVCVHVNDMQGRTIINDCYDHGPIDITYNLLKK